MLPCKSAQRVFLLILTHFVLHMLCTSLSLPRYGLVEFESRLRLPGLATVSSDNFLFLVSDHTILAVDCTGSSVTVSLDDVTALWLEYLVPSPILSRWGERLLRTCVFRTCEARASGLAN